MNSKRKIKLAYIRWMFRMIELPNEHIVSKFSKLLRLLNEVDFTYIIDMDGNRYEDGINLRYRFAFEKGYDYGLIATELDVVPCSVLEMMVALAIRCEEIIMDPNAGLNAGRIFWKMIDNLGLFDMDDDHFDRDIASDAIYIFLDRLYPPDGTGNLFAFDGYWLASYTDKDLRDIEIWRQMFIYLDYI